MSLENTKSSHLPKSVKVRSTCNCCQKAKIRCSHEKPSCRRCQKHGFNCVYGLSERLGRPAKKKDSSGDPQPKGSPDRRRERRTKQSRKKTKDGNDEKKHLEFMIGDTAVEEGLQTPSLTEMEKGSLTVPENLDLSDSWLQDFGLHQFHDPIHERSLLEALDYSPKIDDIFAGSSGCKEPPPMGFPTTSATVEPDYYSFNSNSLSGFPTDCCNPSSSSPGSSKMSPILPDTNVDTFQSSLYGRENDYAFSSPTELSGFDTDSYCYCQCHEQATRELLRVNICATRTAPPSPIDTILTCQRGLQQLAETILQCAICSRTRMNLLMVVIVCIDSLLTTLESTTASKGGFLDELLDDKAVGPLTPVINSTFNGRTYRDGNTMFKSRIEACPLLVGNFRVPAEEKYTFIKQVLQTRLSGLLATIRRIRGCTQGMLTSSVPKGRLIMIMETDRRLQMIMMKIRMLSR